MFLKHNLPALIWALFILLVCGIPGKDLPDLSFWEKFSFDKILHVIIFFIFVLFMMRGFLRQTSFLNINKFAGYYALAIAVFYGGITEILQGTVFAGRNANIVDFIANSMGSLIAMLLFKKIVILYSKIKSLSFERFDDIIFENRFKEYGAYKLRKAYNNRMSISIIITTNVFLLFFAYILVKGFVEENKNTYDESVIISELMDMPPPEKNSLPIPPPPPSSSTPNTELMEKIKFTAPTVVQDSVDYSDTLKNKKLKTLVINNDTLDGSNINSSFSGTGSDIYVIVDEMPQYPGGEVARFKFLKDNIIYPKVATYNGIKGVVYITFIIEPDGTVTNIKLLQGIGAGCDEEALRVTRLMPKWKPGKRKGQPVRVFINMPIKFFSPTS